MVIGFTTLRSIFGLLYMIVSTAFWGGLIVIDGLLGGHRKFQDLVMSRFWPRPFLFLNGVDVEFRTKAELPRKGFLYAFNHASYIDIFVMFACLPRTPRFGAKIELFKIPIFGGAMRAVGNLPIVRSNRGAVMQVYKEAEDRVERGECFALAPEGTRQTGSELGKFKTGPFIFAINAKMPIVPVVISGAGRAMPIGSLLMNRNKLREKMIVEMLDPIDSAKFTLDQVEELQSLVRERMAVVYQKLNQELGIK